MNNTDDKKVKKRNGNTSDSGNNSNNGNNCGDNSNNEIRRNGEISKGDRRLSKPLNPLDIPRRHTKNTPEYYKKDVCTYNDALDLTPREGVFFYIKIPGIIFMATFCGYVIGFCNLSVLYILLVGYTIYFVYNRKVKKFSDSLKSLINYNTRREKSKYVGETVEWLNHIVEKFWENAEKSVCGDVYQNVNRELLKVCPPFLNELKLTEFTLGSRSPFIDRITHYVCKENKLILDLNVGFVPLETSKDAVTCYLGEKQKWNSKIVLNARLGSRSSLGINLPIMVKEIKFTGRIRAIINLSDKNLFVKDVEVCMMELPEFDFTLVPLKTVDIMDVPGLSKWIRKTIQTAMEKAIINPNSIVVDVDKIAQSKGRNIGVVCVQLLTLECEEDEKVYGEIDIDNRLMCQTSLRTGKNIVYNEYFYMIVQDIDEKIGVSFYPDKKSTNKSVGGLFLRNVHLEQPEENVETQMKMDKKIVKIIPAKKPKPRRVAYSKTRLIKNEQTDSFLNTNLMYYPIQKKKTNSAIVAMKLVGVENMVSNDNTDMCSSYCTIIVSPLNKSQNSLPMEYIQNTNSAASLVVSGVLKTDDYDINNIYTGSESISTRLLPPSASTFYIFESKRVFNNNSPNYNEEFVFFARDISRDVVSVCIINEKTSEIIGRVGLCLNDVIDGKSMKYKLQDARSGAMEVKFDFNYIDLYEKNEDMLQYVCVQKITIESISEQGTFYGIVETITDCFTIESFTSLLPVKKYVHVPIHENDSLKFRLFKETSNGDVYIGEEDLCINFAEEPQKTALIINNHISITLKIENERLNEYRGGPCEGLKVVQVKLGKFYNLNEEVFIEFRNQDGIVKASSFSRDKQINNVFTIITGNEQIQALIKSADQGENRILGKCQLPCRFADEKIMLNEFGLAADMKITIQTCNFKAPSNLKKGFLEVYIKSAKNLKLNDNGRVNAFIKVLVNDRKVFKTKTASETSDPIYYESFVTNIDKMRDVFTIQVYDDGASSKNALIAFTEFPLYNINEGFSEVECKLTDAKSFKQTGCSVRLGFNFCRDASSLQIRKRGILGDFFNF